MIHTLKEMIDTVLGIDHIGADNDVTASDMNIISNGMNDTECGIDKISSGMNNTNRGINIISNGINDTS